jgi:hypothetical protein
MKTSISLIFVMLLLGCFAASSVSQEAGGGRLPNSPKKPTETKTPSKTPTTSKRPASIDRIDGKWWTTGNDFGPSEVEFTQSGANISGVIRWADGRNGTINGTLVGKRLHHTWSDTTGNGGSGWLELSWTNFLGGPWHNQRVKDGSWTLNRIEGQWCFGGERSRTRRVTHDAQGRLTIRNEDGSGIDGHMEGPYLFLDLDGQSIKGDMFYKGNRIDFVNGAFWTWCGR